MAALERDGMNTFGAIQSTLNVTLWSFIGVESASLRPVWSKPETQRAIAPSAGTLIAAVYIALHSSDYRMIPSAALRVSASPFGDARRVALGDTAGLLFPSVRRRVAGLSRRLDAACRSNRKAAADDGLFHADLRAV